MNAPTTHGAVAIVSLDVIRSAVSLAAAVDAVEAAFRTQGHGPIVQPTPMGPDLTGGQVHVKAAQLGRHRPVVIKVATGFPGNTAEGLAPGDGVMIVLNPGTGHLQAVLMDRGWLTDVRTAAAVAVAVRHLTRTTPARLAILGTGVQAELTVRTLDATGLLPPQVAIWGRSHDKSTRMAQTLATATATVTATREIVAPPTAAEAVAGADIVITTTSSRTPILRGEWLSDHALVIAVGADSIGKRECDDTVLRRATQFVTDNSEQSAQLGELQHLPDDCRSTPAVELGALLARNAHASPQGIQLVDLTGIGAQDAAIAELALASTCRPEDSAPSEVQDEEFPFR